MVFISLFARFWDEEKCFLLNTDYATVSKKENWLLPTAMKTDEPLEKMEFQEPENSVLCNL